MSFTTLPIDLYDKITSHLVGKQVRKRAPIALGKALSLVCKKLQPIGQALVWKHITVDEDGPPDFILTDLDSLPHLHPYVKSITARVEHDESPEESKEATLIVLKMIQTCQNLHRISIALPFETKPSLIRQLFEAASRLEHHHVFVVAGPSVEINPATIETLHLGFPCLCTLDICSRIPGGRTEALEFSKPSGTRSECGLRRLNLDVIELDKNSMQIPKMLCLLASSFGAGVLVECNFTGPFFHRLTFQWLTFKTVRVQEVSFNHCELSELEDEFIDFVHYLPQFEQVIVLSVNSCMNLEDHLECSTKAPVSLIKLLSSIPLSMHLVELKGVYFYGSLSFPETRLKPSGTRPHRGSFSPVLSQIVVYANLRQPKEDERQERYLEVVSCY